MFADSNPWMKGVQQLAAGVAAARRPAAADNPFLALQTQVSEQIIAALDAYRVARDQMAEQMFFGFYGSPFVQAFLGINERQRGAAVPRHFAREAGRTTGPGGRVRGEAADRRIRRSADPGGAVRHRGGADARPALRARVERRAPEAHASIARRVQGVVRDQFFLLQLERERAVEALASLVPEAERAKELLKQVHAIVGAGDPPLAAERERLARAVAGAGGAD